MAAKNNETGYVVIVEQDAAMSMLLSAIEAYNCKNLNNNQSQNEIFGHLVGHSVKMEDKRIAYVLRTATVEVTGKADNGSFEVNMDSLRIKSQFIYKFFPGFSIVGNYHTHPYKDLSEVKEANGHSLSKADKEFFENSDYDVCIIVTVCKENGGNNENGLPKACPRLDFVLMDLHFYMTAYIVFRDDKKKKFTSSNQRRVVLSCPFIESLSEYM